MGNIEYGRGYGRTPPKGGTTSAGRKRITMEIMGNQETIETLDGTYKIASPIWERGMHVVEYGHRKNFNRPDGTIFFGKVGKWGI